MGRTRSKTQHAIFETETDTGRIQNPFKMEQIIADPIKSTSQQEEGRTTAIITSGIQQTHVATRITGLKRATSDTGNVIFEEEARGNRLDLVGAQISDSNNVMDNY